MGKLDVPTPEPQVATESAPFPEERSKAQETIDNIKMETEWEDLDASQLAKFLSVDSLNSDYMKKMSFMSDWAKSQGAKNFSEIAMKIRDVEVKLGSPNFGERRIPRIFNYIKLLEQSNQIKNQMKAMEKHA